MWTYTPPLREMQFVIEDVLDAPAMWRNLPAFADIDADTARHVLEEAGKFASGVLAPVNGTADTEGCTWRDGEVTTPRGFRAAYAAFVEGGWAALSCHPADGGQGLPALLDAAFNEMIAAANHAWTMYPGLLHGAYECLRVHGSALLKDRYLKKLASGEWLATMQLTEPQAGSDLSLVRTRAEPRADGTYAITGSKNFISGGEHDLTDNIVHLVLARLPGAPGGSKGLSLFLAPKLLPDGSRNALRCDGIEKKMGLKGSATCTMSLDGATAWLIGEPNRGLAAMFVMMNSARLHVGLQGLGHLDTAQRNARHYASERVQGRGVPINAHPAVRRVLWSLRSLAEGGRVIAYWCAQWIDIANHHPDSATRDEAEEVVGLLTPIVKAFLTDHGHRGTNEALQVWGGYGYVHEYGIEQAVRDSRIAMIYEGTNEIQAIDLLQRKVLMDGGARLERLLTRLEADALAVDDTLADFVHELDLQIAAARAGLAALIELRAADPEAPLAVADDFLHAMGFTLLSWAWMRYAQAALRLGDEVARSDKLRSARFGCRWWLPQAAHRWERVKARQFELPPLDPM